MNSTLLIECDWQGCVFAGIILCSWCLEQSYCWVMLHWPWMSCRCWPSLNQMATTSCGRSSSSSSTWVSTSSAAPPTLARSPRTTSIHIWLCTKQTISSTSQELNARHVKWSNLPAPNTVVSVGSCVTVSVLDVPNCSVGSICSFCYSAWFYFCAFVAMKIFLGEGGAGFFKNKGYGLAFIKHTFSSWWEVHFSFLFSSSLFLNLEVPCALW